MEQLSGQAPAPGTPTSAPPAGASRSSRRREREREELRTRLLAAAREIAAEDGWQAVTIRRIADRLEYSSPILYQHFASKDDLLFELVNVGFRDVAERVRTVASTPADRALTALATAYWDFAFSAPELYQAMHGLGGVPFGTAATPHEARAAFRAVREELLRQADALGRELADPDGAVDTTWAYLHGFVSLTMAGRIAGGRERGRRLMLQALPPLFDSLLR